MSINEEDIANNKKNELTNHSVLTNEFINLFIANFTPQQKEKVLTIIKEKDEATQNEKGNVVDFFEELKEQVLKGIEEEALEIKISALEDKKPDSPPPLDPETAKKMLKEIDKRRKIKEVAFDKQLKGLKSLTPEQALKSVEPSSLQHLSRLKIFEFKREHDGIKAGKANLDKEVEDLRKKLTSLKKHKYDNIAHTNTELKKLDKIENVNEKFLTAQEKEQVKEIHQIENIVATGQKIERTPSFSKLLITNKDNEETRLLKYATLQRNKLMFQQEKATNETIVHALSLKEEPSNLVQQVSSPEIKEEKKLRTEQSLTIKEEWTAQRLPGTRRQVEPELNEKIKDYGLEGFKIPRVPSSLKKDTSELNLTNTKNETLLENKPISFDQPDHNIFETENALRRRAPLKDILKDSDFIKRDSGDLDKISVESTSRKELKSWDEVVIHNLQMKLALLEQRERVQKELLKIAPYNNFLLDPSAKKNDEKGRYADIKNDLAENTKLRESIQAILQDKEKLAEYIEKEKPKDKNELTKEIENLTIQTAEIEEKVAELKEIDYKDLKNKWYHVFSRPSFYAFLGRQALWLTPLIFFNAIPGYVYNPASINTMPEITFLEKGAQITSSLKGMLMGTYVAQRLLYAAPKIIPRITGRVSQGLRNRFPKAMEKVDRALAPLSRAKQKINQIGQAVKTKTVTPVVAKIKQRLSIGNSEKLTPEQKANRANGLDPYTGEKLPFTTRAKNATQDFMKSAGKRVWNNKWTLMSMIACTAVFAVMGGPVLSLVAPFLPASIFGTIIAAAVAAFITCGAMLLVDKLILKPIQNRLASRENRNRDQVVMERFTQDKEKGQHYSLDNSFKEKVASIAKIENKEQTLNQEQTNKKESTIDTKKQETQLLEPRQSIAKVEELDKKSQSIVKKREQEGITVAMIHYENERNNKRPLNELTSKANETARRKSITGTQEKNKNEKEQAIS
ncbi:hypothetical protein [Enterococcus villorum]|uniref:Uncharacterized protein n=2 Tax=Enterococcus villorum TaxID=112904 RepID=A0A511J2Q5_9ENTE|nr:hypothetical protein [Enterococcus villorum]EOH94630.1 hypothetical protein UAO_00020 [Enterococcus villorum ATCC 700913]EOW77005.1 hypothetical protein I591_02326 [Enterococcus villorum ATCC 700913]GEL91973.1 hypothetical protein EVI01_13100 [Enterococcus villorum]